MQNLLLIITFFETVIKATIINHQKTICFLQNIFKLYNSTKIANQTISSFPLSLQRQISELKNNKIIGIMMQRLSQKQKMYLMKAIEEIINLKVSNNAYLKIIYLIRILESIQKMYISNLVERLLTTQNLNFSYNFLERSQFKKKTQQDGVRRLRQIQKKMIPSQQFVNPGNQSAQNSSIEGQIKLKQINSDHLNLAQKNLQFWQDTFKKKLLNHFYFKRQLLNQKQLSENNSNNKISESIESIQERKSQNRVSSSDIIQIHKLKKAKHQKQFKQDYPNGLFSK